MKINIQDIITLNDDNEYVVVSKVNYNNKIYLYIVDIHNFLNVKYVEVKKDYISIIDNSEEDLLNILIPLFYENSLNIID